MKNYKSKVQECLLCDGYNYQCPTYITFWQLEGLCVWYKVVENDLEKIKQGKLEELTFPELTELIKNLKEKKNEMQQMWFNNDGKARKGNHMR